MAPVEPKAKGAPPVAKSQAGNVHAAVWRQENEKGVFYSVTFEKRYKDAQGNWQSTDFYNQIDLLCIQEASRQAYADIDAAKAKDRATGRPAPQDEG